MRWGFAHEAGPFQIWDMLGVAETVEKMEAAGLEVADWVKEMLAAGHDSFYKDGSYYDFVEQAVITVRCRTKTSSWSVICTLRARKWKRNMSASLLDMGDGVALFEFHSKMNAIDRDIIDMGNKALERLNSDFDALVMGNNGQDFCVGANLFAVGVAAAKGCGISLTRCSRSGKS